MKFSLKKILQAVSIGIVYILQGSCSSPETLKIGLIGGLSGRVADMGIHGRDGALLAIEEANSQGGVGGRSVELIARNDRQDREACREEVSCSRKTASILKPAAKPANAVNRLRQNYVENKNV